jgi:hypothetical protein
MGAGAAFDLREVALADALADLFLDEAGEFGLRQLPIEAAEGAFDFTEVPEFLT